MPVPVLGLDIGGANLKAAHTNGQACSRPYELWKNPSGLTDALASLMREMPAHDLLAVTMTGELCDCFETKRQGVTAILDAVQRAAGNVRVRVWNNQGRFADLDAARADPLPIAAANWLALATFAGRLAPRGPALLVDIGSTTSDIIPLLDGRPIPQGRTDPERLRNQELVYTGVRRTPVCALLGGFGAAEFFATTLDVYLTLGRIPEDPNDWNTADGRPATHPFAHARLARMFCADAETATKEETRKLAERVLARQVNRLGFALEHVAETLPSWPQTVLVSGAGEFLAPFVVENQKAFPPCRAVEISHSLGRNISQSACAYAVALLAAEESA
jgi:probable H4MPT-linked C1 transfer pathway protein